MVKYICDRCHQDAEKNNTAHTTMMVHLCDKCNQAWLAICDDLQKRMVEERKRLGTEFMKIEYPTTADETIIMPKESVSEFGNDEIVIEGELLS